MQSESSSRDEFHGKVAIVTGGGGGIGGETCLQFAARGARVVIADRDIEHAGEVVRKIEDLRGEAVAIGVEITDRSDVERCVSKVIGELGTVDILVNCAGWSQLSMPEEYSTELAEKLISINLTGTWNFCQAVVPEMKRKRYGKIVTFGSGAGLLGMPKHVVYSAAKAGVIGLTRALAVDMGPYNVSVNCICPGTTKTSMVVSTAQSGGMDEGNRYFDLVVDQIPMARVGQPADLAKAVLFLSSSGSDWITGVILPVDGGQSCCLRAQELV